MSASKKIFKTIQNLVKPLRKLFTAVAKTIANGVLRGLLNLGKKRPQNARAGFALSTTLMVVLVVTLLSTALVLRSFDRSKTASNTRQEQVIQNTATPAIDRARAKLDAMLSDPALPRGTPADDKMLTVMADAKYTFPDEIRLKLAYDIDGGGIAPYNSTTNAQYSKTDETLTTAWKFPVDTDGNGLYDSFSIYGLFWRTPPVTRTERKPLEARSLAQDANAASSNCATAGQSAATSVTGGDWYKSTSSSELSKSFYAYALTIPITDPSTIKIVDPLTTANFEKFKGNNSFAGLEYQQDRYRLSLNNTSVWFDNDLFLSPGNEFKLNGRIFTNGNLIAGSFNTNTNIRLYQVSSEHSCFHLQENAQINVGGNIGTNDITIASDGSPVTIDLFQGSGVVPITKQISSSTKSTTSGGGTDVAYNDAAYNKRIDAMKTAALKFVCASLPTTDCVFAKDKPTVATVSGVSNYPTDLKTSYESKYTDNVAKNYPQNSYDILKSEIQIYLENRTRRVPYKEISDPDGTNAANGFSTFASYLDPPQAWREPKDSNTGLILTKTNLPQTQPERQKSLRIEQYLGDRVIVGNNLPARWKDATGTYVGQNPENDHQLYKYVDPADTTKWDDPNTEPRYRTTQVAEKTDLGASARNGFWEIAAAYDPSVPKNNNTGGGGLRIITGAGIYVDDDGTDTANASYKRSSNSFLPNPALNPLITSSTIAKFNNNASTPNIFVWPDLMPMSGGPNQTGKGDLLMRATAVYHYLDNDASNNTKQLPIACVSSYYDPTNSTTAKDTSVTGGKSQNGKAYKFPGRTIDSTKLQRQARLVFPDGRIANPMLRAAMEKYVATGETNFQLSDYSAVDTAICAIAILDGTATTDSSVVPDNAIKEVTFLDPREIKAIDKTIDPDRSTGYRKYDPVTTQIELNSVTGKVNSVTKNYRTEKTSVTALNKNYDLALEQRQPLEIRVTDIDLGLLANTAHKTSLDADGNGTKETEYLLPNSGIIYASRDDALADGSDSSSTLSYTDFKLDPTRRPNGIRVINTNGTNGVTILARGNQNKYAGHKEEKGLILVTNNPLYIKGNFNLHLPAITTTFNNGDTELEEFKVALNQPSWNNFYGRGSGGSGDLEKTFACREGQTLCTAPGDQWRPASIIADSVTLLSSNFREGYRSDGDFDLRNNAGYSAVERRLANGFFENNFVSSSPWNYSLSGTSWITTNKDSAFPQNDLNGWTSTASGSYFINGVTPIQRREKFSEYVMEMCLKVPVSSCGPQDWVVGYNADGNGSIDDDVEKANNYDLNKDGAIGGFFERDIKISQLSTLETLSGLPLSASKLGAGTTARPAVPPYQRYPRRVAFLRNELGQLVLDKSVPTQPKPKLVIATANSLKNGTNYGSSAPSPVENALWFTTTNNNNNPSAGRNYDSTNLLYYRPIDTNDSKWEQYEFLLPDPTIPDNLTALKTAMNGNTPTTDPDTPADYTVCINGKGSQEALFTAISGSCPSSSTLSAALTALPSDFTDSWAGGTNLTDTTNQSLVTNSATSKLTIRKIIDASADTNKDGAVVYTLPSTAKTIGSNNPVQIVFQDKHNSNNIFVIRASSSNPLTFGNQVANPGVQVVLDGVDPNNVFWDVPGGVVFTETFDGAHHKIAGNLVSNNKDVTFSKYTDINGRLLGFTTKSGVAFTIPAKSSISAIVSTKEPLLEPVLQIHSSDGTPAATLNRGNTPAYDNYWMQQASDTYYNAAFVAGNSPDRPQEYAAGLNNYVRFEENWCGTASNCGTNPDFTVGIKGSFIQLQRSTFATAPFVSYLPATPVAIHIFGEDIPTLNAGAWDAYRADNSSSPYFIAGLRNWGFDIGLLSQAPDLFSSRFTTSVSKKQNYYRQVARDDDWVKVLLCAAEPSNPNADITVSSSTIKAAKGPTGTSYPQYAVPVSDRPSNCPTLPLPAN
jgi:type II secretory pathway pseudopilin PulG